MAFGASCPNARHEPKLLDFKVTQVSDCVIVSAEQTPAGVINLIGYCWEIARKMLAQGYLCRGAIVIGLIFREGMTTVGEGYQRAVRREKQVRIPAMPCAPSMPPRRRMRTTSRSYGLG